MERKTFETTFAGKKLTLEVGRLAGQANGSVRAQYGDTVLLATVVMSNNPREGISYFPLSVEFDEKFYAAGRIKGSRWIKREGRPTDEAILTARLIDRTIRPLFDSRFRNEVQVIITNLSFDGENDPDILALIASSTALLISDIPWGGPVGAVRIGKVDSSISINPTYKERGDSLFDIVVSGPEKFINMIETKSNEASEQEILEAIKYGQDEIKKIIDFQKSVQKEIGAEKLVELIPSPDENLRKELLSFAGERLESLFKDEADMQKVNDLKKETIEHLEQAHPDDNSVKNEADHLFEEEIDRIIHQNILNYKKRPDNRDLDEIRKINCEVGTLPRTHGSGLFERGITQALSILTLGPPGLEQSLETMEFVGKKRFMHHYNFPPFSSGETGRMFTGRREIGHGALAEKAIEPVIPSKEDFPYAIRIVTEILSSNGSTSMAAVCGSSLALMDAGVPIKEAVAGISVGLITEDENNPEKNYFLITDIQGPEDHHGNMDFKVAGTKNGVTAIQMDVKIAGITLPIMEKALDQARNARLKILGEMAKTISQPNKELSPFAPQIISLTINPDKIGIVIGPGGKMINQITEKYEVEIDIEDDGQIFITSTTNNGNAEKALEWIRNLTREFEPGEIFIGKVVKILEFGAFVEILPGHQGLVHISELAPWHVKKVEDMVKVGDEVKVKIKNIDSEGRINLTMKEFQKREEEK